MSQKTEQAFAKVEKALSRLEIMIQRPADADRANVDACIQRFEFSIELFWKLLKCLIEDLGKEVYFPKEVLQEAYASHLISDEKIWLQMLKDRNQTSHTYDEELADRIYENIKTYTPVLHQTFQDLTERFKTL